MFMCTRRANFSRNLVDIATCDHWNIVRHTISSTSRAQHRWGKFNVRGQAGVGLIISLIFEAQHVRESTMCVPMVP